MTRRPCPPAPYRRLRSPLGILSALVLGSALLVPVLAAGTGSAATPSVKPVISGLIDRQGEPAADALGYVSAYVVKVNWADLQPVPFGPLVTDNAIDAAIARVRQPDMAGKVSLKLRVLAGIDAPEWAKEIGGAPLPYLNNQVSSLVGGTIGRFWLPAYGRAYADLQAKLAARYDSVPEIREITVDRCSTLYDELFVRQPGVAANAAALLGAGYTVAADQLCIQQAIAAHNVWRHTTSDVDFSPFPNVETGHSDLTFTLSMMDYCRTVLGVRCGLENNALSETKLADPNFVTLYTRMHSLGGAVTFQTSTIDRIGDWTAALAGGLSYGANSIELPTGYDTWPVGTLATMSAQFKAHRADSSRGAAVRRPHDMTLLARRLSR